MTGWLIVREEGDAERVIPISGRLFVGRVCAGIEDPYRLLLADPAVSRDHLELRADPDRGVVLFDRSTNGTRLNGRRIERDEPLVLHDDDEIEIGAARLRFRALEAPDRIPAGASSTLRAAESGPRATVVGDVIGYSAMFERAGAAAIAAATDVLFAALIGLLRRYGGTLRDIQGDALFADWGVPRRPAAIADAIRFAVEASELVARLGPELAVRDAFGLPLRMGWGVALGDAVESRPSPARSSVHGDATNLAFRLSGLAARDGRPTVLVTREAAAAAPAAARYGDLLELTVRNRSAATLVHGAERVA